jgi:UDP-N-acetylmuramyl tripeptide synthase
VLSRRLGRGGGTSLPGKLVLRLQPDAIGRMAARISDGTVLLSATNGKTTTATMLAAIVERHGRQVVHNSAGANMPGGVATALLESPAHRQAVDGLGIFEVDEAWLGQVACQAAPRVLVLANLFRDQLDRYGELEKLADAWRAAIDRLPPESIAVLCADDPLVAGLGAGRPNTIYFGIDDRRNAEPAMRHAADSKQCRECGAVLEYDAVQLGHLGTWHCPDCSAARPEPNVRATRIELHGMRASDLTIGVPSGEVTVQLPLPGLYNAYNALAAAAAAVALGVPAETIASGLAGVRSAFGRTETIAFGDVEVPLLLVKNPTGANEVLRTVSHDGEPFDLWVALNDGIADGRDVSWVWDADFERIAGLTQSVTCSGRRAEEMALRLAYAGVDRSSIHIEPDVYGSFAAATRRAGESGHALRALPTYTALLELRTELARHGYAPEYWNGTQ